MPARLSAMAMPSPPNPAPTTTTRYVGCSGIGALLALCMRQGQDNPARPAGPNLQRVPMLGKLISV